MFNEGFEFDLDFLNDIKLDAEYNSSVPETTPKFSAAFSSTESAPSSLNGNLNHNNDTEYNNELISLTKKIENYNKVVLRLKKYKSEKEQLEKDWQSLNKSAIEIKCLYEQENAKAKKLQLENKQLLSSLEKTQIELNNISEDLSIKHFDFEQSKAELENNLIEYKEKLLPEQYELYNKLGIKYVDMAKKLQEYNLLEQMDKTEVQRVINHLKEHNISIKSLKRSPRRNKSKPSNTLEINNSLNNNIKSEIILDIKTKEMKTQGTQYISSSTTRSTCTSTFIKKHDFGSNFPEIVHLSVDQILREMIFDLPPSISPINDFEMSEHEIDLFKREKFPNFNETNTLIVSPSKSDKILPNIESDELVEVTDTEKVNSISLESVNNKLKSPSLITSRQKKTETKQKVHSPVKNQLIKVENLPLKRAKSREIQNTLDTNKIENIEVENDLFNQEKCVYLKKANASIIPPLKSEKLLPNIESDAEKGQFVGIVDADEVNCTLLESLNNEVKLPSVINSRQHKTTRKSKIVLSQVKNHLLKPKNSLLKDKKSKEIHKNSVKEIEKHSLNEVKSPPNFNLENDCVKDSENIISKEKLNESTKDKKDLSIHQRCANLNEANESDDENDQFVEITDEVDCISLNKKNKQKSSTLINSQKKKKEIKPKIVHSRVKNNFLKAKHSPVKNEKLREIHKNSVKEDEKSLIIGVKSTPNINLENESLNCLKQTVNKNHTVNKALQIETMENHVNKIFDMEKSSSKTVVVEDILINPSTDDPKISPKRSVVSDMNNLADNKNISLDDSKLVELFGLSSSDTEELERSFECINDLSINKIFSNDSTLEAIENHMNKEVSDCKKVHKLSPIKSKDCVSSEQNVGIGKNTSSQFNDLYDKLRENEKKLLDHEKDVTSDTTEHHNYATKLQTLKQIKNLFEESQMKENVINLLNEEISNCSLTNLWNLMGETIFKLIDHSKNSESSSQMQFELLSERIHVLSKKMENEKKSETPKINSEDKNSDTVDTFIDTRNSDVISPISELSSIEFLNTETQNSVETLTENENEDFSSIFLEKMPRKPLKSEPCKRTLRSGKSYNNLGKISENKNIRNQKNKLSKSNLKNKLDAVFMVEINFAAIKSCDDKGSAVYELLKEFPTQKKRCRKSSDKHEINDELEVEENEKISDTKKIKLDELDKINEEQLHHERTLESLDTSNAFCNSKDPLNLLQENEKVFNNFVDRILKEFIPPKKMSPIQELTNMSDAESENVHDDCLIPDIYDSEIPLLHQSCEDIVENLEVDFQSPESPPHFFQESNSFNITEIPFDPYNDDSPASPSMPFDVEHEEPILIPGKRIVNKGINCNVKINSLLGKHISQFQHEKYNLIRHKSSGVVSGYQTTLIKKLCGVLEHFIKSDGTSTEVQKCLIRLVKRSKITKLICKAIVETVENIAAELNIQNTPPCPNMTVAHQKIIYLCDYLGKHIKGFTETLTDIINLQLFSLKNTKKTQYNTLINLTQLYIGIIDLTDTNKSPARLFICKCLYYYNQMAIPLIYQIIAAYPGILPHREDPEYDHSDPVITTIQCVLNSLPYNMEKKDLRHPEMFHILKLFYGYERVVPSKEQVVENFIAKLRAGRFHNLSYSFAVICKQNGVDWTERFVINTNLVPLIHEYFNEIKATDKNDQNISALLETISFIIKPSNQFHIEKFQQIFSNFLYATDRKVVQESAVRALLRTSRFGLKNCFILLCRWSPTYSIEPATKIMLQSFIYKKPISFWRNLLNETKT